MTNATSTPTLPPSTSSSQGTSTQTWDPTIVNLAKAIRQNESGNTVVPGKTGELPSRYQWEPDTWKAAAGEYLKNPNAPLTLENENYVAYQRIKSWKDAGMNPMQIASMWNSGKSDPNNNPHTAQYAQNVYATYQKYKLQGQTSSQVTSTPVLPKVTTQNPFQGGMGALPQKTGQVPAQPFQMGINKVDPTGVQSAALAKAAPSALPLAGSIVGGAIGGAAGGLVSSPTILGIPAGAAAGAVAGSALGGAAGEAAKEGIQGGKLSAGNIAKTGAEFGALEAIGGPAASLVGKTIEGAGKKIAEAFIPTSAKEAALLQSYKAGSTLMQRMGLVSGGAKEPITAASTAFEKGLVGSETRIGIKAQKVATNLWSNLISPALKQSKLEVDMPTFFKQVEDKIIKEEPELSRQKDLLNALSALKEDYSGVERVSLQQLQKFKEGWARFVPEKAYKGQPIAGLMSDVKNTAAGLARSTIYSALGNDVKQAYLDYGNLQALKELGQKAMAGSKFKGGAGGFMHGLWEMATVPIGTIGGQTIYKVGQGVEFLGSAGIKTLGSLFGVGSADQTPTESSPQPSQQPTTQPILPQQSQ